MFKDAPNGDLTANRESGLYKIGWKNFPMNEFGVQKESLKKLAKIPEIPELVITNKSGSTVVDFDGGQIKNLVTNGEVSATGMHAKIGVLVLETPIYGNFSDMGILKGDVILKVNGVVVDNIKSFKTENSKGKLTTVAVWRDQRNIELKK